MGNKWEGVDDRGSGAVSVKARTGFQVECVNVLKRECVSECVKKKKKRPIRDVRISEEKRKKCEAAYFKRERGRKQGRKEAEQRQQYESDQEESSRSSDRL